MTTTGAQNVSTLGKPRINNPRHSRLGFRAEVIESLADDDEFQVTTPVGVFRMTKAQFHKTFANVARSMSYRERGLYHYPTVPSKAERFRVG